MAKVQVLLPVYNCERFLTDTLRSLLEQDYQDFEILALDDGSSDRSGDILQEMAKLHPKIKLIKNQQNRGIIFCRNHLFDLATSEYLAIADADDIYHPNRLSKQVKVMDIENGLAACSTAYKFTDSDIKVYPPESSSEIAAYLTLVNVFANPCAMIRRSVLEVTGLRFEKEFAGAADFLFWYKLSQFGNLKNIPEVLFSYRQHPGQESRVNNSRQRKNHLKAVQKFLAQWSVEVDNQTLADLIWPEEAHLNDLRKVSALVNKVSNKLKAADTENSREIEKIWDIRLRSLCRRFGWQGFKAYIMERGINSATKGKKFGLSFFCLV
ncbi:MAG: glycosyltransferase [Alteromonadaceae bacterium]|nr:glycosyltransferase [Alteromonadaceae bacterium]